MMPKTLHSGKPKAPLPQVFARARLWHSKLDGPTELS